DFAKAVGIEEIKTLDAFFEKAQKYIAYEEKQMTADVRRPKGQEKDEVGPSCRGNERRKDKEIRESKSPPSKFTGYTPLNAPREQILAEVSSVDFRKAGI
ncbi:hypothetical protein A2U01_0031729, partial [Trifolium medium]|nr:hypothetical protein [Trifolium medium]